MTNKEDEHRARVGVMTWYSYRNYGTVLQALALQIVLRALGCEGKVINYDPQLGAATHEHVRNKTIARKVRDKARWYTGHRPVVTDERETAFDAFIDTHIPLTSPVATDEEFGALNLLFDCFVCGSDQVWSPRCFDAHYYLDFVDSLKRRVAYAPSFGCDSLDGFSHAKDISRLLKGFAAIGVRETSGASIVEACTGVIPRVVLDPTLLLSRDEWLPYAIWDSAPQGSYALFYFLGEDSGNRRAATNIALRRGLRIVDIPVFQRDLCRDDTPGYGVGPGDFLALLAGADLVCTDSFHGMAFSALFSKPLVAFERFDPISADSQNTRIYSFLDLAGMRSALLSRAEIDDWEAHADLHIDYDVVQERLEKARLVSIDFLDRALCKAAAHGRRGEA